MVIYVSWRTDMDYEMTCCKTGRFWPCNTYSHGDALAMAHGIKDYEIKRVAK
jgi:hypothetical protein